MSANDKCTRCGNPTDNGRLLCSSCYGLGKVPDTAPIPPKKPSSRAYYTSAIDGPKKALLTGPYDTHQEALDMVDAARDKAVKLDPMAWFYAYGTCSIERGLRPLPQGKLNGVMA